jgi:hypothetical protein
MARIGRTLAPILVIVVALCVPALAVAKVTVPPGSTEGDQYFEEVPNGAGSGGPNHPGGGGGGAGGDSGAQVAATQQLDQLGPDGQQAAALANANKPPAASATQKKQPAPPSQQASSTEGDGGMGIWFPLIIAASAVVALAFLLRRRLNPAS